jgi:hypothetical protein
LFLPFRGTADGGIVYNVPIYVMAIDI